MNNNQATISKMKEMKLHGMADSFQSILETGITTKYTTDEMITHLIDSEWTDRNNRRRERLRKAAGFRYEALSPFDNESRLALLDILEDRHGRRSTIFLSQLPVSFWHTLIGDTTIADAIMDRIAYSSYRIELKGESIRKKMYNIS
ncbi:MAG: ATP-binding protein [Spirochaetota bacterium]|nr:ATP-binding protein [Spirochaetota bacterium]